MTVCYGRSHSQTKLIELHLFDTRVAGDVAGLAPLRELEDVALQGTRVSGDIAAFARHPGLRRLRLDGTEVSRSWRTHGIDA